ncbi:MAG TPA: cytochrome c oxidase assembly protein [Chthoniobacterales bacterium]
MDQFSAFRSWKADPILIAGLLLTAFIYFRGWRQLQHFAPKQFTPARLYCFLGGLIALFVAVASPLDVFAGFLLQVHMVQHLLLTMLVPALLLLGAPYLPFLKGLPRVWVRDVIGPFLNGPVWKTLGGFFSHPVVSWGLFIASNVLWHVPSFYDATLRSDGWHAVEHACFLGTSLLFWWHVVLPFPAHPVWPRWYVIPYLLLADFQNTALGAFLSFYDQPLYSAYATVPRLWGISVIADQAGAGAIMWVPGSIAFLVPAAVIAAKLLGGRGVRPSEYLVSKPEVKPVVAVKRTGWFIRLARTPMRRILQTVLLLLAVAVVLDGFFGPPVASMNLAGVLTWTYWRGLSVLALLTLGNFFCSVCPFILARDTVRKFAPFGQKWQWPKALRNKWSAISLLAVFLWAYEVFDLWNRPLWTAILIVAYFAAAIGVDVLFRGASFCKYVCPIGQYHFAFAGSSSAEIAISDAAVCASCRTHDCLRGNDRDRGCETHLFQPKKSGNMDCTFCLDCVRACPADNVTLKTVVPVRDLTSDRFRPSVGQYSKRLDLAVLFGLFVAGAFLNAFGMTAPVVAWSRQVAATLGWSESAVIALLLPIGIGLFAFASWLVSMVSWKLTRVPPRSQLLAFAVALTPIGAGMWAAHFLFHLATGAFTIFPVVQRVFGDLGFKFAGSPDWTKIGFSGDWIIALELLLLDAGLLGSLYVAWRIASRVFPLSRRLAGFAPWAALVLLLFVLAVWTMFQPMDMRGTMMSGH